MVAAAAKPSSLPVFVYEHIFSLMANITSWVYYFPLSKKIIRWGVGEADPLRISSGPPEDFLYSTPYILLTWQPPYRPTVFTKWLVYTH